MHAIIRIVVWVLLAIVTVGVGVWIIKKVAFLNNIVFGATTGQ